MPDVALQSTADLHHFTGPPGGPVVVALGGISATRDATQWWRGVARPGGYLDTSALALLGIDWLDGGAGDDGRPLRAVSTHDQADALARALDAADVARAEAVIGASYGGMVALAFAERYPDRVGRIVIVSAPAFAHPMATALRIVQRRVVELGLETGRSYDAMVLARALATTTYRSAGEFAARFTPATVESYLLHQGEKLARRCSPARFLALSLSADRHQVDPRAISTPATFIAAEGDTIVPREQIVELADRWRGPSRLVIAPSRVGHDAFLAEPDLIGPIIRNALDSGTRT